MVEVNISKKLNNIKLAKLLSFLHSMSDELCFSSFHTYKIDEDTSVEILNEYKNRCKERHSQLKKWYTSKEPFFMNVLKKLKVKTDEDFEDYSMFIFEEDMKVCKTMDDNLLKLQESDKTRDYKEVFKDISKDFKFFEIHMFDSVSVAIVPIDYVIYNASEEMLFELMKMPSLDEPFKLNKEENVVLVNPVFAKQQEAFAAINTSEGTATIFLDEKQYAEFKKLKIKHTKDYVDDEEKQL